MSMLVLSRRVHEKLVLPSVPATIQVVAVQGSLVRLGVEAPPRVAVLREEIYEPAAPAARPAGLRHVLRNRLHNLGLGLGLLRRQLHGQGRAGVPATLA